MWKSERRQTKKINTSKKKEDDKKIKLNGQSTQINSIGLKKKLVIEEDCFQEEMQHQMDLQAYNRQIVKGIMSMKIMKPQQIQKRKFKHLLDNAIELVSEEQDNQIGIKENCEILKSIKRGGVLKFLVLSNEKLLWYSMDQLKSRFPRTLCEFLLKHGQWKENVEGIGQVIL